MTTFYRIAVAEFGDRDAILEDFKTFIKIVIIAEARIIRLHAIFVAFEFFVNHGMIEHH